MKTFVVSLTPAEAEGFCSYAHSCKYSLWYPPKAIRDYVESVSSENFNPFRIIFACKKNKNDKFTFVRIGEHYFCTNTSKIPYKPEIIILNEMIFASVVITEKYYSKSGIEFTEESKPRFYRQGIPFSAIGERFSVNISECEFIEFSRLSFAYDIPQK